MLKKFWAAFVARNKEFVRDRASLGWSLLFPFLIILGFGFMFSGDGRDVFKVAVLGEIPEQAAEDTLFGTRFVNFIPVTDLDDALLKVGQHRYDLVLESPLTAQALPGPRPRYWINSTSANGYLAERILLGSSPGLNYEKQAVEGREVRYVDWLLPGVLAMNMMFGALFGVGFVLVRYRKMGVLRRLKATPLSAFEFLSAQIASRLVLIMGTSILVYIGCDLLLDFQMIGSYLDLFIVFVVGTMAVISMGLVMAARTASEELAGGLLNLVTFPMMILSGVWFSLDGAPEWVQNLAKIFPLTHLNDAARAVMTDGRSLIEVGPQLLILVAMTLVFLTIGSVLFRWE